MHTPSRLLAAVYSFFLLFAAITSAQGQGEFPHAGPPSRTTQHNENHPTGAPDRVNVGHRKGDNRVVEVPAEPTGKHGPQQFPTAGNNGKNVPSAKGMSGGHRISLKDVDHPDRKAFANKQQNQAVMMPPPSSNSTNSTAPMMKRWTNPYKLPTKETKRAAGAAFPGANFPDRRARRRWFNF